MGANIPLNIIALALTGVLLIICGNYLPKCRQNYTIGIKLPWTLHDANNWNKTHRMAGYLWIFCGVLLIVRAFLSVDMLLYDISITAFIFLPLIVLPVIYSYILYKRSGLENQELGD